MLTTSQPTFADQQSVTLGASLFPPSAYIDKHTGECVGENIDISRKILTQYSLKLEVVCALPIRMYRLIEHAEVDFTVNVKLTEALKSHVVFIDTPLKPLVVNLYRHGSAGEFKTISAIRGFDYNGARRKLIEQQYQFIDLPTAEAALQLFLRARSDALISYQSNVAYLQQQNGLVFPQNVTVTQLLKVNAYYGIAKGSEKFELLQHVFNDYAEQHKLKYFVDHLTE